MELEKHTILVRGEEKLKIYYVFFNSSNKAIQGTVFNETCHYGNEKPF